MHERKKRVQLCVLCTERPAEFSPGPVLLLIPLVWEVKTASWVTELGVYEVDEHASDLFICQNVENLAEYFPLYSYQRGARLLIPLKHIPRWSL